MGKKLDRRRQKTVSPISQAAREAGLVLSLTRRDALIHQLDTAIRMYFLEQDPISIHLLLMPAFQVLRDLAKGGEKAPELQSYGYSTTVYDWLRHASSDPRDTVDFPKYLINDSLLWVCSISFEKLFGGRTAYMSTFQAFFVLFVADNPKFREGSDAFLPDGISVEEARALGRLDFFVKLTEMFSAEIKAANARRAHSGEPPRSSDERPG